MAPIDVLDDNDTEHGGWKKVCAIAAEETQDLDLATITVRLVKRWPVVLLAVIIGGVAGAGSSLLMTRQYDAEVTFLPSRVLDDGSGVRNGGLGAAVRSLGFGDLGSESDESELIASLASTRRFLGEMVDWKVAVDGDSLSLGQVLVDGEPGSARRRDAELEQARRAVHVVRSDDTQLMVLRVRLPLQDQVSTIANRLIGVLAEIHGELVGRVKDEEVDFIAGRLEEVEADLRTAEEAVKRFSEQNAVTSSPELRLDRARLEREVQLQQELFLTLRTQFELARIKQIGGRPVISVVDRAEPPLSPSAPEPVILIGLGFFVGFLVGVVVVLGGLYRQAWVNVAKKEPKVGVS